MKEPALELAFAGGIDQSQRSELLDPRASFVMLENVRSRTKGAVEKRQGFDTHANGSRVDATSRTAGYRMFADGKKTCIIDRDVIDVFSPDNDDQVSRGRVPECGLSMMKVPAPPGGSGQLVCTDAIRVGDYLALAYTSGTSVYASVVEAETGQVIVAPSLIYTGSAAEIYGLLGARGSTAMLFVVCSGEANIQLSSVDCSSATGAYAGWSAAAPTISDCGGLPMAVHSIGTGVYLGYVNNSGGASKLTVNLYDGGVGATVTVNTATVAPGDIGLGGNAGDTLWVTWAQANVIEVMGLNTTTLATIATAAPIIGTASSPSFDGIAVVASSTTGAGRLFANNGANDKMYTRNFSTVAGATTAGAAQATHYSVQMAGRPFRIGTRYYGVCRGQDSTESVAILCDLTEANAWVRPVANVAPGLASSFFAAQATQHTSREFWFPVGIQTSGSVVGAQMARFDFDAPYRWRAFAHNGVTFLSGGLVTYFDGVRAAESGFVIRPPAPIATDSGGGSGLTGVFRYVVTYEQVDSAGNWHVSGVSDPGLSPTLADNAMTVTVHPLGISARIAAATDPGVRICIYRTAAGGESPYYFLTSLANTLTSATQTYTDSTTDTTLETHALLMGTGELPGTGAQQDRRAPSGMDHLCSYNGFLVGALGETVFWSGQDVSGEGTWWNPLFQQPVSGGGDIQALDCQDGTVFAWKRDRIFALAGQPPADNGGDGGLGAPVRLAVDIGARCPITCVTSLGIFFVSDRGIELLNRARGVDFIGEGVQDTFDAYPHVTSMTYDAASSCVLIECASTMTAGLAGGTGRTIVYDTRAKVWRSIDRRAVSATSDVPAQDGCMVWNGSAYRYGWLRTDGTVYAESDEHKLDPGDTRVRMYGKTSCVHLSGIQGEQNIEGVLLLGEHVEDHNLTVGVANDYSDTFVSETRDSDDLAAMLLYNPHFDINQQTGQAVQVEIQDAAPTGTAASASAGDGAEWVALTFIGSGSKSGVKRTSSVLRGGA